MRLLPEHGRVVRNGDGALFFVDINSTGMFEDALVRVETPIAKRAQLLTQAGEVVIVTLFFEKSGALGVVSPVE